MFTVDVVSQVNSALHPCGVAKSSTSFSYGKGTKVTTAGWHVISLSSEVISTNCYISALLTYLLSLLSGVLSALRKVPPLVTMLVPMLWHSQCFVMSYSVLHSGKLTTSFVLLSGDATWHYVIYRHCCAEENICRLSYYTFIAFSL